jgi:hypothetical protein
MQFSEPLFSRRDEFRGAAGSLVLGVTWPARPALVGAAADLAAALEAHLVCAFVDPASYLTEWEPAENLLAASLDPVANDEAAYPSDELRQQIEDLLGVTGIRWSFRVLNGDVAAALSRLADSIGASALVVGAGRNGILARISRNLEGSVSARLTRMQSRPVVVIPEHAVRRHQARRRRPTSA